jgi:hypothetical protein
MIEDDNTNVNYKPYFVDENEIEDTTTKEAKDLKNDMLFIPTWNNKPPYKEAIIKLNNQSILSFQNITCILAKPGSGKSSTMEAVISCIINPQSDNLHFSSTSKSVLYIDFERTELDVWNSFYRVMIRAGVNKGIEIENVKIVSLRRTPTAEERKKLIENLIIDFKPELLLLDGIGDLVDDTNSLPEAIQCKVWARRVTSNYKLSILTTLHPNKGSDSPRGHIGSEMLRECENILLIKVNNDESRTITTDFEHGKSRNSGHAEASFTWSEELKMFVGIETLKKQSVTNDKKAKLEPSDIMIETYIEILGICYAKKDRLLRSELLHQLNLAISKEYAVKKGRTFYELVLIHLQNIDLIEQIGTAGTRNSYYILKGTEQKTEQKQKNKTEQKTEQKQKKLNL